MALFEKICIVFIVAFVALAGIGGERVMGRIYEFLGRLFFPRQQDWERFKNARIMAWVMVFSLILALVIARVIKYHYSQSR